MQLVISRMGYVYVLECADGRSVKIGRSRNPSERLADLRSASNSAGRQWISALQADSVKFEMTCHKRFAHKRERGEWFAIDFDSAVAAVESMQDAPPTDEQIAEARKRHIEATEAARLSMYGAIDSLMLRARRSDADYSDAADFVISAESISSELDYLARFDALPLSVAELVAPVQVFNTGLIASRIPLDQRKAMLRQYAMDWRLSHTAALEA